MKNVSGGSCRENQNPPVWLIIFSPENHAVREIMWKNLVEPDRPQMAIWRMRVACWITKATNSHSEYVILIVFPPYNSSYHERTSVLRVTRTYSACPVFVTLTVPVVTRRVGRVRPISEQNLFLLAALPKLFWTTAVTADIYAFHIAEPDSNGIFKSIKISDGTVVLPVVLYGCETWSLTLREERRLGVFENRVARRIFGPKRDEVTGEWRKLHNE